MAELLLMEDKINSNVIPYVNLAINNCRRISTMIGQVDTPSGCGVSMSQIRSEIIDLHKELINVNSRITNFMEDIKRLEIRNCELIEDISKDKITKSIGKINRKGEYEREVSTNWQYMYDKK